MKLGQEYMAHNNPAKTSILRLFRQQVKYISPLLWAAQFAALILVSVSALSDEPSMYAARNILWQLAPLSALLVIPELIKDSLYQMTELENSCKNSGSVILLLRLLAVGGGNVSLLSLLACILSGAWGLGFFSLILYALVPYFCVNAISLGCMQIFKIRGRGAAFAVSLLSAAVLFALPQTIAVANINAVWMLVILIGTALFFAIQMRKTFRSVPTGGEPIWN